MLRSTFYSFTTALRGLNTAQKQLDITGQNISNVGTTGYTRQRADVYSATPAGYGDKYGTIPSTTVGQGSVVGSISQCRDQFLDVRFRRESASLGEEKAKLDTMEDVSNVLDEIEKGGLMSSFNDFVSKLQSLANNASSSEFDGIARNAASTLVKRFNEYAKQLSTVREEKEYNLKEVTGKAINDLMSNIAKLNESIREVQCTGGPALELKDERNLLLDQLSNYAKLDVQYTPKEIAGGIVVEDVSISMVGKNGVNQPLIYNDTAATFNVKTPSGDGTDKAIVTIDNSQLPAVAEVRSLNNLLKTISMGNNTLKSVDDELAKLYPTTPPAPAFTYADLPAKITQITNSIVGAGQLNDQITAAATAVNTAINALNVELAKPTPTPATVATLRTNLANAISAKDTLVQQKDKAVAEKDLLSNFNHTATTAANNISTCDAALRNALAAKGITATKSGGYTSSNYTFEAPVGTPIKDASGNNITWKVGSTYTELDRGKLAELGITFTNHFDAEDFASPGALKGAIDMLNSEGVFDYKANEVRGIGYYESMLDSLAGKLATCLNNLNDKDSTTVKENLFQTSDGSGVFTAKNLKIADGWLNGKYGITGTKKPSVGSSDNTGQNDNILLMISTISSKLNYTTGPIPNKDANGNYLKTDAGGNTTIVANGRDANGNYTLNGVLITNEDMVNFKSITPLNKIDADNYQDSAGHTYSRPVGNTANVFTYNDGLGNITAINSDGILYKGNGSTGEYQLDAVTLSEDPANLGTYKNPSGTTVANGKAIDGSYTMTTTNPTTGKDVVKLVANPDGVMYKTDVSGNLLKDSDGNYILDAAASKLDNRSGSFLFNGTFGEYLSNVSNVISLDVSSTSNLSANHEAILEDIQTSKDEISNVSLDEEGVNIMQFQKAYNAAARLMTALDEAVERIINQMGTVGR
ncbi:MAG: flagellar basal body rod C-terminal domain-containing protein [Aminipila sp.]